MTTVTIRNKQISLLFCIKHCNINFLFSILPDLFCVCLFAFNCFYHINYSQLTHLDPLWTYLNPFRPIKTKLSHLDSFSPFWKS